MHRLAHLTSLRLTHRNVYHMYLHQYQAYDLLKRYQVPLVPSFRASTPEDALSIANRVMSQLSQHKAFVDVLVKAQVHAGGRGKGIFKESGLKGGVQTATRPGEVFDYAERMLGKTLVTPQTGKGGRKVNEIFLVQKAFLRKELYVSFVLDRDSGQIALVTSSKGGMSIEEVQKNKVHKFLFPAGQTVPSDVLDQAVKSFQLPEAYQQQARDILPKLHRCFADCDATLLEINPLGVTIDGRLIICDSKMNIDDNAAFRQRELFMMEDRSQKNWKEVEAERWDLNYISLDGNIGCIVNGAGLAMATMDLIASRGGRPANFLDVGGRASDEQIVAALRIMENDPNVESILVNIFAGIARADIIALGLIKGIMDTGMKKPIVLRMKGTNIEEARQIIADSGFTLFITEDLEEAALKSVKMADILKMAREARLSVSLI